MVDAWTQTSNRGSDNEDSDKTATKKNEAKSKKQRPVPTMHQRVPSNGSTFN